jgi:hypothetical protein
MKTWHVGIIVALIAGYVLAKYFPQLQTYLP